MASESQQHNSIGQTAPIQAHALLRSSIELSVEASVQNSTFDSILGKCRKLEGCSKHSRAEKDSLTQKLPTRWNSAFGDDQAHTKKLRTTERCPGPTSNQALYAWKKLEAGLEHCW